MDIKKCEKGHFYNGEKYASCPHCAEMQQDNTNNVVAESKVQYGNMQITSKPFVRGYQVKEDMAETVAYRPPAHSGNTLSYESKQEDVYQPIALNQLSDVSPLQPQNALPVGWLVAVSGLAYGKQYPIFTCDNFIGSNIDNSICIKGDAYVLPEHHCTLSFDIQTQKVVLNMESSNGAVYLNNAPVTESCYLSHADWIQIGGSVYMFVELCREGFSWWQPMEQKQIEPKADDDIAETSVLTSATWRCSMCNALNLEFAKVCRVCGAKK